MLELALGDASLQESLRELVTAVEKLSSLDVRGSILLTDARGECLKNGAAPSLSDTYNAAIDGLPISANAGSCGSAAFTKNSVFVADVLIDPLCTSYRELANANDIRAWWSAPIPSAQGQVLGTFALYHRDVRHPQPEDLELIEFVSWLAALVIERKRTQIALQLSEDRLQEVFSQAPVPIGVFRDRDFTVELVNSQFQTLLPVPAVPGQPLAEVVPDMGQVIWDAFDNVMTTGEPFVGNELLIPCDQDGDGKIEDHWFNVVYHPLREGIGGVSGIVAVRNEVTAQIAARRSLERANRELEEFAYVASHDLQEPLRMINIYTELLVRRVVSEQPNVTDYRKYVQQGVKRMETLIHDLLTYSRTVLREELPVGTADLDSALAEAKSILENRVHENRATIRSQPLPIVRGETKQLAHVFQNLLSNALKYRKTETIPRDRDYG